MNKRLFIGMIILILGIFSNSVLAKNTLNDKPLTSYFRLDSGISKFNDCTVPLINRRDAAVRSIPRSIVGTGIGLDWGNNLRTDFIYHRHLSPVFKGSNTNSLKRIPLIDTYTVNLYYDIKSFTKNVTPYIGGGIGIAHIKEKVKNLVFTKVTMTRKTNKAYKIILGTYFDVTDKTKFDISYHYHNYGKSRSNIVNKQEFGNTKYRGHMLMAGVRLGI